MINEKNLNFPRILCLNEQNDTRPRHQLSRLEAANVPIGKIRSLFPEKLPRLPRRLMMMTRNFLDSVRKFSSRSFHTRLDWNVSDAAQWFNPPSRLPIFFSLLSFNLLGSMLLLEYGERNKSWRNKNIFARSLLRKHDQEWKMINLSLSIRFEIVWGRKIRGFGHEISSRERFLRKSSLECARDSRQVLTRLMRVISPIETLSWGEERRLRSDESFTLHVIYFSLLKLA